MTVRSTGEDAYFAASNSASGFFSYYSQIFDTTRVKHLYAVKGGPGTGKSRFLRDVAQYGERRGWRSEYIYCSSDPDSLDGVILSHGDDCMALLDATAPHVYEPSHPGLREEIVNLGAFWNTDALVEQADAIEALNAEKSAAYRRAYRYLAGAGQMAENRDALAAPYIRREAIVAFAEKLMQGVPFGTEYRVHPSLIRSVGMRGEVGFDTYFAAAKKLILIEDCRGSAQYLMDALGEIAVRKKLQVRVSHDPILPHDVDGLFLCDSGIAFVVGSRDECDYPHKLVGMRRFVDTGRMRSVRDEINYAERMRRALQAGAVEAMEKVREVHFRIEEIYTAAMDFPAKEEFTKKFCHTLFDLQNE